MRTRQPPSRLITAREFADAIGIAQVTAWRWIIDGKVETEFVGPRRYILRSEIDRYRAAAVEAARNIPDEERKTT